MWRLKVINSCVHNDDLVLPVSPQPSVLQQFYTCWRDEDENINKSEDASGVVQAHNVTTTGKRRAKKRSYKVKRVSPHTTLSDWVNRIPHVALGRHTRLPASYRLRHPCASRLHCRVAYIADAPTHKQLLTTYPSFPLPDDRPPDDGEVLIVDRDAAAAARDAALDESRGVFHGPHYRILNCGTNPVYVNREPLPRGRSRRLRERDIIAFLEDPFDAEGGVLEPLRPADAPAAPVGRPARGRQASPAIVEDGAVAWLLATSAARALFSGHGGGGADGGQARLDLRASLLSGERREMQPFVEVNGVRVARRRLPCVPVNAEAVVDSRVVETLATRRGPSLAVEHNRLVTVGESESLEEEGVSEHETPPRKSPLLEYNHKKRSGALMQGNSEDVNTLMTPPPKSIGISLTSPHYQEGANTVSTHAFSHNVNFADDGCMDIVEGVVSPLQQRFVASPNRNSFRTPAGPTLESEKYCANSVSAVSARLPVYVFARRSPSPQGFTRQAPSIGRLQTRSHTRVAEDEEREEQKVSEREEDEEQQEVEEEKQKRENKSRNGQKGGRKKDELAGKEKKSGEQDGDRTGTEVKDITKEPSRPIHPNAKKQKTPPAKTRAKKADTNEKQVKRGYPGKGGPLPKEKVAVRKANTGSSLVSSASDDMTILDIGRLKKTNNERKKKKRKSNA